MGLRQYNPAHFIIAGEVLSLTDAILSVLGGGAFTTAISVTIADAALINGVNVLETLVARKSTSPNVGFGSGIMFRLDNSSNVVQDAAQIAGVWVSPTAGAESSAVTFYTRDAGGAVTEGMRLTNKLSLAIGATATHASAKFQIDSTTRGMLPPRHTSTQRDAIGSPAEGLFVHNLTTHAPNYFDGTSWLSFGNVVYTSSTGEALIGVAGPIGSPGAAFRYDMGIYGFTQAGALRGLLTWDLSTGSGNIVTLGNTTSATVLVYKAANRAGNGGHYFYSGTSGTAVDAIDNVSRIQRVPMTLQVSGTPSDPASCSILDIISTALGVLFPRMTTTQRNAIPSPVSGLIVFDTTLARYMEYRNSAWAQISDNALLIGLAGSTTSYYGAMNSADHESIAGNVTASAVKFHHIIDTTADRTIVLPTAAAVGDEHLFEDDTGNALVHNVTFTEQGGGLINGNSTYIESVPFFGRKARKKSSTVWVIAQ